MGKCKFLIGLGVGSVLGVVCYHFMRAERVREWKERMNCLCHQHMCEMNQTPQEETPDVPKQE